MIRQSSFMYTVECIRPCKGGKRAIATCNRNKKSVREHSCMGTQRDTRYRSIRNISEREKDRRNKMCLSTRKKDSKIHRRQSRKKKNRKRQTKKKLTIQRLILFSVDDGDIDLFLFFFFLIKIFLFKMETKYYSRCFVKY